MAYTLLTDFVDLSVWAKKDVILNHLKNYTDIKDIDRQFRSDVAKNNRMFLQGEKPHYIVHSNNRGYKWAANEEEIANSTRDLERRAYTMLKHSAEVKKSLNSRNQSSFCEVAGYRKAKNLTAEELVAMVKNDYPDSPLDGPMLSKIETGKVLPNHETMVAISEALGVGTVKLFGNYAIII